MLDQTAKLKDWLGRSRKEDDELSLGSVRRLAAMLDQDPTPHPRGSELPESWYAILFGPVARQSIIGRDGHPKTGDDLLPPLHNTRRMFAGRRATFHRPLKVGDMVERVSTVRQVEPKTGRTGSFVLVTIVHEISAGSGLAVTEEQDLVYREDVAASAGGAAKPAQQAAPKAATEQADHTVEWKPDTVQLFRYSALTFNGHRIHYDRDYVTKVEGYPGLIFHGPLQAALIVEFAAKLHGGVAPKKFSYRGVQPLFAPGEFSVNANESEAGMELWTANSERVPTMKGTATW